CRGFPVRFATRSRTSRSCDRMEQPDLLAALDSTAALGVQSPKASGLRPAQKNATQSSSIVSRVLDVLNEVARLPRLTLFRRFFADKVRDHREYQKASQQR